MTTESITFIFTLVPQTAVHVAVEGALRAVAAVLDFLGGEEPEVGGHGDTEQSESSAGTHTGHGGKQSFLRAAVHDRQQHLDTTRTLLPTEPPRHPLPRTGTSTDTSGSVVGTLLHRLREDKVRARFESPFFATGLRAALPFKCPSGTGAADTYIWVVF
ncbi:hypothetical protein BaRGS_00006386 [Batillaria attramentaria]|uniref:Uncharacterized protein n=1 Tax=Batillaria attramentaria TaxID=370345 RepID=A0ABD0LSH9_9CAEN